jgi:hypothetical protein
MNGLSFGETSSITALHGTARNPKKLSMRFFFRWKTLSRFLKLFPEQFLQKKGPL